MLLSKTDYRDTRLNDLNEMNNHSASECQIVLIALPNVSIMREVNKESADYN